MLMGNAKHKTLILQITNLHELTNGTFCKESQCTIIIISSIKGTGYVMIHEFMF